MDCVFTTIREETEDYQQDSEYKDSDDDDDTVTSLLK